MSIEMTNRNISFFSIVVLCTLISACATSITREILLGQMQEGTAPLIVDVRSQGEFDQGHVPGALHISFYSAGSGLRETGFSKKDPVVLYCEHGPRTSIASFTLYLSGYDQVYALQGHMKGWREHEYPIEVLTH